MTIPMGVSLGSLGFFVLACVSVFLVVVDTGRRLIKRTAQVSGHGAAHRTGTWVLIIHAMTLFATSHAYHGVRVLDACGTCLVLYAILRPAARHAKEAP